MDFDIKIILGLLMYPRTFLLNKEFRQQYENDIMFLLKMEIEENDRL